MECFLVMFLNKDLCQVTVLLIRQMMLQILLEIQQTENK
jgi:hypothetical protein